MSQSSCKLRFNGVLRIFVVGLFACIGTGARQLQGFEQHVAILEESGYAVYRNNISEMYGIYAQPALHRQLGDISKAEHESHLVNATVSNQIRHYDSSTRSLTSSCGTTSCDVPSFTPIPTWLMPMYPYAAVVYLLITVKYSNGQQVLLGCSGYQMSPNVVYSAGHCFQSIATSTENSYTFVSAAAYFGYTSYTTTWGAVSVCGVGSYGAWLNSGDSHGDQSIFYLCRPAFNQANRYFTIGQVLNTPKTGAAQIYKAYGFPCNVPGSMVETVGSCQAVLSTSCGIGTFFWCPVSVGQGMSGGPLVESNSGYVVASTDLLCTSGATCWAGFTPYTDQYNVFNLLAVFGQ